MRYKFLPSIKKVSPYDNYPCGILRRCIVQEDDTINSQELFSRLNDKGSDVSDSAAEILNNPESWQVVDYNRYPLNPRSITEIIVVNLNEKVVKALYSTVVGGGDDHWAVIGSSLQDLADLLIEPLRLTSLEV